MSVKNELTEYKQLYVTDSSRGPKDTILHVCSIDCGPLVSLWRRFDKLRQEGYKENRFQNASNAFRREAKLDLQNKQAKW